MSKRSELPPGLKEILAAPYPGTNPFVVLEEPENQVTLQFVTSPPKRKHPPRPLRALISQRVAAEILGAIDRATTLKAIAAHGDLELVLNDLRKERVAEW